MPVFDDRATSHAAAVDSISVFVVDRERAVAQAIAHRLDAEQELAVVGSAQTAGSAAEAAIRRRPDVVVLDEAVADGQLAELAARFLAPNVGAKLVVTSASEDVQRAFESARVGASAFVTKASGFDEMVRAILGAVRGESWIPPRLLTGVLEEFRSRRAELDHDYRVQRLTQREREVLRYMMAGFGRARIADELIVSINTVRTHAQNILWKLEVHSSLEAVSVALRAGFPSAPHPAS
jgi:NarL family two-component system response regulator LiaR